MSPRRVSREPDLHALQPSWELALRAARLSPATVKSYVTALRLFLDYCDREGLPARVDKATVGGFVVSLLDAGQAPKTAHTRHFSLRRFSAWLVEEGEIAADPLLGMKAVKLDRKVTPELTIDECNRLVAACRGTAFRDRRDGAIIRLMLESAMRAGEVVAMTLEDLNLVNGVVIVRRGKGNKGRLVPFGPQTGQAIDRYLRARRSHSLEHLPDLWLGDRGRRLHYPGLAKALQRRAAEAKVRGFHAHLTRHTAAQRWLAAGGSEQGLMAVAGWESRAMLDRYTRASASSRAIDEHRRLNLGDLG